MIKHMVVLSHQWIAQESNLGLYVASLQIFGCQMLLVTDKYN